MVFLCTSRMLKEKEAPVVLFRVEREYEIKGAETVLEK